jgi:hypothetical protein
MDTDEKKRNEKKEIKNLNSEFLFLDRINKIYKIKLSKNLVNLVNLVHFTRNIELR